MNLVFLKQTIEFYVFLYKLIYLSAYFTNNSFIVNHTLEFEFTLIKIGANDLHKLL